MNDDFVDEDKVDQLNLSLKQFSYIGLLCISTKLMNKGETLINSIDNLGIS
jgi:hypothetical protein